MIAAILAILSKPIEIGAPFGYLIGILITLFVFGYLIYALAKPEKF
jgi:K+-transporting ATPase KdpF subunit